MFDLVCVDHIDLRFIFNEWLRRYNENPEEFNQVWADDQETDYGSRCAKYFMELCHDLHLDDDGETQND